MLRPLLLLAALGLLAACEDLSDMMTEPDGFSALAAAPAVLPA